MTDRPTPETDKIIPDWMQGVTKELPNFVEIARKMERERDEARDDLEFRRELYRVQENYLEQARKERDEAREERDIARLETEEISQELANARKQIEGLNNFANERYEEIQKVRKERDEAREQAQQMSESNQVLMADVRFYRDAWEQLKDQYGR